MVSPVKSRDNLLIPDFSGKRHAKTRHVMGNYGKSPDKGRGVGYIGTNNTVGTPG